MDRRSFAAVSFLGIALPLVAASSRADELEQQPGPTAKPDPATRSPSLGTDELVARVETFYAQVTSFKASFKEGSNLKYDRRATCDGSVIWEKPGKMSWRYSASGNRVVSDGNRIQVYERESQLLYEHELGQSLYPVALSFLTAQGKLTQNFEFSQLDAERSHVVGSHVLLGQPLQHSAVYGQLLFYVDALTYQVRRVLIIDVAGSRHRFDFVRRQMNARVPHGEFSFSPPPGTRMIRL